MRLNTKFKRHLLIAAACGVIAINGSVLYASLLSLVGSADRVRHSLDVKRELARVVVELSNAESGQRGYLLTNDIRYLDPYYNASSIIRTKVQQLKGLVSDNAEQRDHVLRIAKLVEEKFAEMSETIVLQSAGDPGRAAELVRQNRGKVIALEFHSVVEEMEAAEEVLLKDRRDEAGLARDAAFAALGGFILATVMLLGSLYYLGKREIRRKVEDSQELAKIANELQRQTGDLTRERNEVALLNEASNFLQSCDNMAEISALAGPFLEKLFQGQSGAIHITASSRNRLDYLTSWGDYKFEQHFAPHQCWGLRRGQVHGRLENGLSPACDHHDARYGGHETLCVPLVAHGETLGLLSIVAATAEIGSGNLNIQRLAEMVSRQLGLTLANIRLRESLKDQAIRDPMTNAFNRRYLDVVAEKEIAKARRFGRTITVAMIDIDHFKRFNDTHGHQAGDVALVSVCRHIQSNIRDSDWLFRYGGEEFLIMFADTASSDAASRLDSLRAGISELSVAHDGAALPQVTISCGLASFPDHADSFDEIVSVADEALYQAKQSGRNRVVIGDIENTPVALSA